MRRSQNWIGGSRPGNAVYVPPPPHALAKTLGALEKYVHAKDKLPPLVRVGLLHVQFETIHPYLDGNGRIGRILVTLLLDQARKAIMPTTKPTAGRTIELLAAAEVLVETTGRKRDRSFMYRAYLDRLKVGTELEAAPRSKKS